MLLLLALIFLLYGVEGFLTVRCRKSKKELLRIQSISEVESEFPSHDLLNAKDLIEGASREVQIWLDLRESAIFPKEALEFLDDNLFRGAEGISSQDVSGEYCSIYSLISKFIVSPMVFKEIRSGLDVSDAKHIQTACVDDSSDDIFEGCTDSEQTQRLGTRFMCQTDEIIDPLKAIEVAREGQWILMDSPAAAEVGDGTIQWMATQLECLYPLLSTASLASVPMEDESSGLLISSSTRPSETTKTGGLAIACPTREALVTAHASVAAMNSQIRGSTMTDSGIFVASRDDESSQQSLICAFVLPFDVLLWKTASDLGIFTVK